MKTYFNKEKYGDVSGRSFISVQPPVLSSQQKQRLT